MGISTLSNYLINEGFLSDEECQSIAFHSSPFGPSFAKTIIALGLFTEDSLAQYVCTKGDFHFASSPTTEKDAEKVVPEHLLTLFEVLPMSLQNRTLTVALIDPFDERTLQQLRFFTSCRIKPVVTTSSKIQTGLKKILAHYLPQNLKPELMRQKFGQIIAERNLSLPVASEAYENKPKKEILKAQEAPVTPPAKELITNLSEIPASEAATIQMPESFPQKTETPEETTPPPQNITADSTIPATPKKDTLEAHLPDLTAAMNFASMSVTHQETPEKALKIAEKALLETGFSLGVVYEMKKEKTETLFYWPNNEEKKALFEKPDEKTFALLLEASEEWKKPSKLPENFQVMEKEECSFQQKRYNIDGSEFIIVAAYSLAINAHPFIERLFSELQTKLIKIFKKISVPAS